MHDPSAGVEPDDSRVARSRCTVALHEISASVLVTAALGAASDKELVALHAARQVTSGMLVGLGTGSTANLFIAELGRRCRNEGLKISAVSMLGKPGEPDDIANAVAFLASPLSGFITAQILTVDGGRMDYIGHP